MIIVVNRGSYKIDLCVILQSETAAECSISPYSLHCIVYQLTFSGHVCVLVFANLLFGKVRVMKFSLLVWRGLINVTVE
jgi:hypothetical protein